MARLSGKAAVISGGAAGIGSAAARLFSREGAAIAIVDIDGEGAGTVAKDIQGDGGVALAVAADITDADAVARAVGRAAEQLGRLDVLLNCAGGSLPEDDSVAEVPLEVWQRTIDLDLKGTFLCCRAAIPHMISSGGGSIVNMSSGAALRGASPAHVYTSAKGAILSFTRALAGRYARDNIRANAICAGRILTKRILDTYGRDGVSGKLIDRQKPVERAREYPFWIGEPIDIANIALFLASVESRMITGATIAADGGRSAY